MTTSFRHFSFFHWFAKALEPFPADDRLLLLLNVSNRPTFSSSYSSHTCVRVLDCHYMCWHMNNVHALFSLVTWFPKPFACLIKSWTTFCRHCTTFPDYFGRLWIWFLFSVHQSELVFLSTRVVHLRKLTPFFCRRLSGVGIFGCLWEDFFLVLTWATLMMWFGWKNHHHQRQHHNHDYNPCHHSSRLASTRSTLILSRFFPSDRASTWF